MRLSRVPWELARSILSGNFHEAAVAAGIPAASYGLSVALARPRFVRWLADTTRTPPDRQLQQLTQLQVIADRSTDPYSPPMLGTQPPDDKRVAATSGHWATAQLLRYTGADTTSYRQ